jgi:hypothetical protein
MNTFENPRLHVFCIPDSRICFTVSEDHEYIVPRRAVTCVEDMNIWEKSEAYFVCCKTYFNFIVI